MSSVDTQTQKGVETPAEYAARKRGSNVLWALGVMAIAAVVMVWALFGNAS